MVAPQNLINVLLGGSGTGLQPRGLLVPIRSDIVFLPLYSWEMDYVLDLSTLDGLPPGEPRDSAERAARAALERHLGGSSGHVLLARLDCEVDGGAPAGLFLDAPRPTPAQLRWIHARTDAVAASLEALVLSGSEDQPWDQWFEQSSLRVSPAAPAEFAERGSWTRAFAERLKELRFDFVDEPPIVWAERGWLLHGAWHPIWAADEEFAETMSVLDLAPHPRGTHPAYFELRDQLRHLMN